MSKLLLLAVCYGAGVLVASAQDYRPIQLWGYNHDVIAEGPGSDVTEQTSTAMDAPVPSNFVLFSKEFAKAMGMGPGYGLPDDGKIISGSRTFKLGNFNGPNVVYLPKGSRRVVSFVQPLAYESLSILGTATEGPASVSLIIYFLDGTSLRTGPIVFNDWFDGPDAQWKGFGRVKREAGSQVKPLYFEGAPANPRLYAIEVVPPADQAIQSIEFQNSSPGEGKDSNRAFIFAITGLQKPDYWETPVITDKKTKAETHETGKEIPYLHGTVTDAKSHKPIDATVQFNFGFPTVGYTIEGIYRLYKVYQLTFFDKKEYLIKVTAPGYLDFTDKITAATWPTHNKLNFELQPIEVGTVVKLKGVLFKQSTAVLVEESYAVLDDMVEFLVANPKVRIELAGHTDNRGEAKLNLKLSQDRVNLVKKYLISKGIDDNRVTGRGYGGTKPIVKNDSEESRRLNRRVEFVILGK